MLRRVLVPVRGDGKGEGVLLHAARIARRFGAHVQVTHCRPRPEDFLAYSGSVPGYLREQVAVHATAVADAEEATLRTEFDRIARELGLQVVESADKHGPSISWTEDSGRQVDVIRRRGRLADLIVVPKPDRDRNLGANTLKSALFHTARPVLMCPHSSQPPASLGARVAIAWNGSLESTRAVAMNMDLIGRAEEVLVLVAGDPGGPGSSAEDLRAYLAARGVASQLERLSRRESVGRSLLDQGRLLGIDLLIMGAYGQSHERETVLGGNTQTVVDLARMPVILVH